MDAPIYLLMKTRSKKGIYQRSIKFKMTLISIYPRTSCCKLYIGRKNTGEFLYLM